MRRRASATIALLVLVLAVTVGAVTSSAAPDRTAATKLTVWVGWSAGTELKEFQALVEEYDKKHADVDI